MGLRPERTRDAGLRRMETRHSAARRRALHHHERKQRERTQNAGGQSYARSSFAEPGNMGADGVDRRTLLQTEDNSHRGRPTELTSIQEIPPDQHKKAN